MTTKTGRPRRTTPARRLYLTLDEEDVLLLEAYAQEVGRQPARAAGDLFRQWLRPARTADGRIDKHQVEAALRAMRGEDRVASSSEPRWEWPVEAILADRQWWDRWLPDLDELLGRPKPQQGRGPLGTREAPILDRRGYLDLLEFVFPPITASRGGVVSWRSPQYGEAVDRVAAGEDAACTRHVWESVIRHVTRALCALEKAASTDDPIVGILTQDHITGPWLRTLRFLTGEAQPPDLPRKRLL
jgi:hypothetical protein